jgi:hypothetical protein
MNKDELQILRVDCLHDGNDWSWNNWWKIGAISKDDFEKLDTNRKLLKYMRDNDYLNQSSIRRIKVYDDQYNVCFQDRSGCTILAIEYGPAY